MAGSKSASVMGNEVHKAYRAVMFRVMTVGDAYCLVLHGYACCVIVFCSIWLLSVGAVAR